MTQNQTKPRYLLGSFSAKRPLLVALVLLLGLALRVFNLGTQPLWFDEGYSVFFATRDLYTMLARTAVDIHPPLYYILLQLWMRVFDSSDVTLRLLSIVFGTCALPVFFTLAKRLTDFRTTQLALLLLAISPFHIYYSQEVRMYGLVTLLGLLSVYLFIRLLDMPQGTPRAAVIAFFYILASTAALYTQYYAAFVLLFEAIYATTVVMRQASTLRQAVDGLKHWVAAWFTIVLLYLPWVIYAGLNLYTYVTSKVNIEGSAPLDPATFLVQQLVAFSVGHVSGWLSVATLAFVVFAIIGLRIGKKPDSTRIRTEPQRNVTLFVLLWLFVPLCCGYLVNLVFPFHPFRYERLLLIVAPPFYLLVANGITRLWRSRRSFGFAAVAVILVATALSLYGFYIVPRYAEDDYRSLISNIQQVAQPGDNLVAVYPWQIGYLESYYHGAPLRVTEAASDKWVKDPGTMAKELDSLLLQSPRVWVPALQTQGRVVEDALDAYLRPRTYTGVDTWFGNSRLELFARLDDPPPSPIQLPIVGSGTLTAHFGIDSTAPIVSGNLVPIWLESVPDSESRSKVSLRLVDAKQNVWSEQDTELESGRQRIGLVIPFGTPPGSYNVEVAFYSDYQSDAPSRAPTSIANVNVVSPSEPNLTAIPQRVQIDFQNGMRLLGFSPPAGPLQPGLPSGLGLYWQAPRTIGSGMQVRIRLDDAKGHSYDAVPGDVARGIYAPAQWQPNDVVLDPQLVALPANAPDGSYACLVGLLDQATNGPIQTSSGEWARVGIVNVRSRPHYFGAPTPTRKSDINFGGWAQLIGYDITESSGATVVVLYWHATGTPHQSYTAFAHILGQEGTLIAQHDQVPGSGQYPTTTWVQGEYLVDPYRIDREITHGVQLEIGFYDPVTGARVPVLNADSVAQGDHAILSIEAP